MMRACVVGWPIAHSRSPSIHNHWLAEHRLAGSYGRETVEPGKVRAFVEGLPARGILGCNVTVPLKEEAFAAVSPADAVTKRLGAVNTIYFRNGRALGTNTDGEGFLASVAASCPGWWAGGAQAAVLGAGGSARAVAGALIEAGASKVTVLNRTVERARAFETTFGAVVEGKPWSEAGEALASAGILVNATSLGMTGQPELDIALDRLPPTAIVADLVYVPFETALLRRAKARGNPVVPGLGMLLHQAVRGFELWFGVRPEVTEELRRLVAADVLAAPPKP